MYHIFTNITNHSASTYIHRCFPMLGFQALHQVIHPMHMKTSIRGLLIQQAKPVSPKEPVFTRSSLIKWVSCLPKSIQKASKDLSFVNSII